MPKRLKTMQTLYLSPEATAALDKLAVRLKTPKAQLLRDAVDTLLKKHGASNVRQTAIKKRSRPVRQH